MGRGRSNVSRKIWSGGLLIANRTGTWKVVSKYLRGGADGADGRTDGGRRVLPFRVPLALCESHLPLDNGTAYLSEVGSVRWIILGSERKVLS